MVHNLALSKSRGQLVASVLLAFVLASLAPVAFGDASSAIQRIKSGPHSSMPTPEQANATGNAGEGMTIENGTGQTLYVYFDGPVSRSVKIPSGSSIGVALTVGSYEVAGEIPKSNITPFYGTQTYEANTHYWLKFYVGTR